MNAIELLKSWGLLNWSLLLLGIKKKWATKDDVIDFSLKELTLNEDESLISLATCENLPIDSICELIQGYLNNTSQDATDASDKWRLAFMQVLFDSPISLDEKVNSLQRLYSDFGYPEDMKSCSIYSRDSIAPVIALNKSILGLKSKFCLTKR